MYKIEATCAATIAVGTMSYYLLCNVAFANFAIESCAFDLGRKFRSYRKCVECFKCMYEILLEAVLLKLYGC